jgi:hypothetical protein
MGIIIVTEMTKQFPCYSVPFEGVYSLVTVYVRTYVSTVTNYIDKNSL